MPMVAMVEIQGSARSFLLIGDHASNLVPDGIDLRIDPDLLEQHIAIDIGVAPLGHAICAELGCAGILGGVSRLVIDYNREIDAPGLIPLVSDGHEIRGNQLLDDAVREERINRFWHPYHALIAGRIVADAPALLISLHSFTPQLRTSDGPRLWQVGVLYNRDERAARIAIPLLEAVGAVTGDNLPYSGKVLNATMNAHAEANSIPYLGLEIRQDLIADEGGVRQWARILAPVIRQTAEMLA